MAPRAGVNLYGKGPSFCWGSLNGAGLDTVRRYCHWSGANRARWRWTRARDVLHLNGPKAAGEGGHSADFDSTIRRFDPSRPSQKSSRKNNYLEHDLRRISKDSMSRHVAKISVCFQGFPNVAGGSTRHGRDMVCLSCFLETGAQFTHIRLDPCLFFDGILTKGFQ